MACPDHLEIWSLVPCRALLKPFFSGGRSAWVVLSPGLLPVGYGGYGGGSYADLWREPAWLLPLWLSAPLRAKKTRRGGSKVCAASQFAPSGSHFFESCPATAPLLWLTPSLYRQTALLEGGSWCVTLKPALIAHQQGLATPATCEGE